MPTPKEVMPAELVAGFPAVWLRNGEKRFDVFAVFVIIDSRIFIFFKMYSFS